MKTTPNAKVWRNDDVSHKTEVGQFEEVHKLFKQYTVLHTIAVICKDIEKNPELIKYINENNIDVQVHCWEHKDFTELSDAEIKAQLKQCITAIKKHFKHTPDTFYPPWNKADERVAKIAKGLGLTVSNTKVSLSQYIRTDGDVEERVINFHSWSLPEIIDLEAALKIYTEKR